MKEKTTISSNRFQYNFSKNRSTLVEFDIGIIDGNKVAMNIKLTSNWRAYYPKNPKIHITPKGEYCFSENEVLMTNGDIQQMILRINRIIETS